jgi:hypothetical protein
MAQDTYSLHREPVILAVGNMHCKQDGRSKRAVQFKITTGAVWGCKIKRSLKLVAGRPVQFTFDTSDADNADFIVATSRGMIADKNATFTGSDANRIRMEVQPKGIAREEIEMELFWARLNCSGEDAIKLLLASSVSMFVGVNSMPG